MVVFQLTFHPIQGNPRQSWILDSGFWILDLGLGIPIVSGILDSLC